MPDYAVIALGGKQYRVREGERLLVDRLAHAQGEEFAPRVLAVGEGGRIMDGGTVSARIEDHVLGEKIRVRTYRAKSNQKRQLGHRSRLSRIVIDSIAAEE